MAAQEGIEDFYPFQIDPDEPWEIDVRPVIESTVIDLEQGEPNGTIAARFHNTLSVIVAEVCRRLRERENLNRVCLSGGSFQNMLLLNRTFSALTGNGFEVYLHQRVPPNDGGIALGQAVVADALLKRGA
jgi:hydrogenase maturation protein HypF